MSKLASLQQLQNIFRLVLFTKYKTSSPLSKFSCYKFYFARVFFLSSACSSLLSQGTRGKRSMAGEAGDRQPRVPQGYDSHNLTLLAFPVPSFDAFVVRFMIKISVANSFMVGSTCDFSLLAVKELLGIFRDAQDLWRVRYSPMPHCPHSLNHQPYHGHR